MPIVVGQEKCVNPEVALRKEWLETNGLGGYASSTILNCHTRKYHGFLVAALRQPSGKFVLLSKVDETLVVGEKRFNLSTNKYPGVYYPTGHMYMETFSQDLWPSLTYRVGDIVLKKDILLIHGEDTVLMRYELLESGRPVFLRMRPFLAYRGIHAIMKANLSLQVKTYAEKNGFKIEPYQGMPPLHMSSSRKSIFYPGPRWYYDIEYLKEMRRGFDYQEDLF